MKKVLIIMLFCFTNVFSQNNKVDSLDVSFKAKLFTVSEYGVSNKNQILKDIDSQKVTFLRTEYKNFLFMKIDFSQPYRFYNNSTRTLKKDCSYYIAFNIKDLKYYKLGGFDDLDIDSFFKDLDFREGAYFLSLTGEDVEEINIYCLYEYYKMSKKKRLRKGYKCLTNCSQNIKTKVEGTKFN